MKKILGTQTLLWLIGGAFAAIAIAWVEVLFAGILQLFLRSLGILEVTIDVFAFPKGWEPTSYQLAGLLVAAALLRSIGRLLQRHSANVVYHNANARLRLCAIYEMLLGKKNEYVPASEIHYRISELYPKAAQFCQNLTFFALGVIQSAILAVVLLLTAWKEVLLGFAGLSVIGIVVWQITRAVRKISMEIPTEQKALVAGIERIARNWLFVKILRTEAVEHTRLSINTLQYARKSIRAGILIVFTQIFPEILGVILLVGIVFFSLGRWETSGTVLLTFLYLFVRLVQILSSSSSYFGIVTTRWPQFSQTIERFRKLDEQELTNAFAPFQEKLQETPVLASQNRDTSKDQLPAISPPSLEFKDLSFSYTPDSTIVKNLSFKVLPGDQIGIVGQSGSGKSTIIGLMLGILRPTSGQIEWQGMEPVSYLAGDSSRVGYVGAEPYLIAGTLRENICYGSVTGIRSDEEIFAALEKAQLLEFVRSVRGGLDYSINENGDGISAGQKQRLCLARALLSNPNILILDEASANLDTRTESEIAKTIAELKGTCTVIIVSHRPGILEFCQNKLSLDS